MYPAIHAFEDLISRIGAKAHDTEDDLPEPAAIQEIRRAEEQLTFSLPEFLVALYTNVANGGFGPGAEMRIPGYNVARLHSVGKLLEVYFDNRVPPPESGYEPWPIGVVPMLYWGGFHEAAIDCFETDAPVLLYDANTQASVPWKLDAPSLVEWWTRWVDGSMREATEPWERRP